MMLHRTGKSSGRVPFSGRYNPYQNFGRSVAQRVDMRKADSKKLVDYFKSKDELKTATNDEELLRKIQELTKPKLGEIAPRCFILTKKCFQCCQKGCKKREIPFSKLTPGVSVMKKLIKTFRWHVGSCCGKSRGKKLSESQVIVFQLIENKLEIYGAAQIEKVLDAHEKFHKGITELWKAIKYQRWEPEIPLAGEDSVTRCEGINFHQKFDEAGGLTKSFVIRNAENLGVVFPPAHLSITQILEIAGRDLNIEPNNISTGKPELMKMERLITELEKKEEDRTETLNLLNFYFTGIENLTDIMQPPKLVMELSMIEKLKLEVPQLHNTLLATMAGSYTDFHVDFGGVSVNMHIVKGEKLVFMLPPSEANLKALEQSEKLKDKWIGDVKKNEIRKVVLKAGDSFLMPSGWIHAVYTPVDTLVFSGGFFTEQHIEQQIRIYEFEKSMKTPIGFTVKQFARIHALYLEKFLLPAVEDANQQNKSMATNEEDQASFHNFLLIFKLLERKENSEKFKTVISKCKTVKEEQERLQGVFSPM